jgi:hypothetical protein
LCCFAPSIPSIGKEQYSRCDHQAVSPSGSCGIYEEERPPACSNCLWILGLLEEEDRPDRIGVIFESPDSIRKTTNVTRARLVNATNRGRLVVKAISRVMLLVVTDRYGNMAAEGPKALPIAKVNR